MLIGQAGKYAPYIFRMLHRSEIMIYHQGVICCSLNRILYNVKGSYYLTSRHRRVWKATPPPQEREQSLGSDHGPQLPDSGDTAAPPSITKLPGRYVCVAA